ncbi:MAG: hypothetical protein PHH12_01430 [Candidatus Shapirobacteria bacterium]|nr:hypothetical protein [Candidatus Shapirobacteria bacterium]
MFKNKDDIERIIKLFINRHTTQYKNIGIFVQYVVNQFNQSNQFELIFNYKEVFETLNLIDYYENEFNYSFFFAASIFLFNQLGYKVLPTNNQNQIIVIKTI